MLKNRKKALGNILCVFWAMAVALFWFAMRVIWSGISKVLYEALGKNEPTTFLLNVPLYINIFLWILFAFAVCKLPTKINNKIDTQISFIFVCIFNFPTPYVTLYFYFKII